MLHNSSGLAVTRQEAAERLVAPFPIHLTLSRQAIDGWSQRPLTEPMSDDQMEAFVTQVKVYLEEVALPELIQTAYEQIVRYVPLTERTRKTTLSCKAGPWQGTASTASTAEDGIPPLKEESAMPLQRDDAAEVDCLRRFAEDSETLTHLRTLCHQWLQLPLLSSYVLSEDESRRYTEAMQRYHRLRKDMQAFAGHIEYLQKGCLNQMQAYAQKMPHLGTGHEPSNKEGEARVVS